MSFIPYNRTQGDIPEEFAGKLGDRLFGCRYMPGCLSMEQQEEVNSMPELEAANKESLHDYDWWAGLTEEEFNRLFREYPLERAGYGGVMRNLKFIRQEGDF
ncbi:MAG: hypothetical protein R2744_01200 [Bacteroidales bacterium]